jgi:hypothetical protein
MNMRSIDSFSSLRATNETNDENNAATSIMRSDLVESGDSEEEELSDDVIDGQNEQLDRSIPSSIGSSSTVDEDERIQELKAFVIGDRVRIAHIQDLPNTLGELCSCPFTQDRDEHFGKFGRVIGIYNERGEHFTDADMDDRITLRLKIKAEDKTTNNAFLSIRAIDTVNYSLLGDEKGNELFLSTCDKELPWQNMLYDDDYLMFETLRLNMIHLSEEKQEEINIYTQIFQVDSHRFYHRMLADAILANREARKVFVDDFLCTQLEEFEENHGIY